jgi:hypothetical protein
LTAANNFHCWCSITSMDGIVLPYLTYSGTSGGSGWIYENSHGNSASCVYACGPACSNAARTGPGGSSGNTSFRNMLFKAAGVNVG